MQWGMVKDHTFALFNYWTLPWSRWRSSCISCAICSAVITGFYNCCAVFISEIVKFQYGQGECWGSVQFKIIVSCSSCSYSCCFSCSNSCCFYCSNKKQSTIQGVSIHPAPPSFRLHLSAPCILRGNHLLDHHHLALVATAAPPPPAGPNHQIFQNRPEEVSPGLPFHPWTSSGGLSPIFQSCILNLPKTGNWWSVSRSLSSYKTVHHNLWLIQPSGVPANQPWPDQRLIIAPTSPPSHHPDWLGATIRPHKAYVSSFHTKLYVVDWYILKKRGGMVTGQGFTRSGRAAPRDFTMAVCPSEIPRVGEEGCFM